MMKVKKALSNENLNRTLSIKVQGMRCHARGIETIILIIGKPVHNMPSRH